MSHSNRELDLLPSLAGENSSPAAAKVEMNAADESGAACSSSGCPHQCVCMCVCGLDSDPTCWANYWR